MSYLHRVRALLDEVRAKNRYREVQPDAPHYTIDFSSNDYLGLARDSRVVEALRRATRVGSGGARLLGGRHREHWMLEEDLADFCGRERALLFSSGYLAALGAVTTLAQTVEAAYSDERNHASLIDGLRLSASPRHIFAHRALPPKAQRIAPALLVPESIFSMDGDRANLGALLADLNAGDVLLVDEAHALGVAGPCGGGLARALPDDRVIVLGTLSKALGAHGGFIAGPSAFIDLLANSARSFIFDTALPPAVALAARIALYIARSADDRRASIAQRSAELQAGLPLPYRCAQPLEGPIVPVLLGEERRAKHFETELAAQHIYAPAVRPPTVPPQSSRLRLSIRSDHTAAQMASFTHALTCLATS